MPDGFSCTRELTGPLATYQEQLGGKLVYDSSQLPAIKALDSLFLQLCEQHANPAEPIKGLYLWGDVGRGKTFLMDLFYHCLPQEGKLRLHFHHFMARIHKALEAHSGQQDPLVIIAKELASECRILCFDEFFVSDIGDAMLLAGLFDCLFKQGVVLVATSNIPIQRLYENGLARHKFLPCIALLQRHTHSLHLDGEQDHRLHLLHTDPHETRIKPRSKYVGISGELDFSTIFTELTKNTPATVIRENSINICHRDIPVIRATDIHSEDSLVWFDFYALCEGPRSQLDYMEIAASFNTVMLSGVPQLGGQVRGWIKARGTEDGIGDNQAASTGERIVSYAVDDDMVRRFISLIDELYEQKASLYLTCDVPLAELYLEGALIFEFRRTYSRLIEMSQYQDPLSSR
ncbi:cell division protein ZapE [Aliiglaciecola sp. LCG003]|uniref:cell division protein ZapE n=1 Tax=Aliiglaciecola sp. LCG003 TaxID=3053655 RepID=UPI002574599A|nr:cell division protein ZapE [Aliiglaciecola sp. LCG003]WJG09205.1 cell division protein ZapE [Aliiglaciecola sp. LCG003]